MGDGGDSTREGREAGEAGEEGRVLGEYGEDGARIRESTEHARCDCSCPEPKGRVEREDSGDEGGEGGEFGCWVCDPSREETRQPSGIDEDKGSTVDENTFDTEV